MIKIVVIDSLTIVIAIISVIIFLFRWKKIKYKHFAGLIVFYLFLYALFASLMFVDWAGVNHNLESFEDLAGAVLPILWLIVFYLLIERVNVRKLEKNEERLKLVIQGANLGLWDWDMKSQDLIFNRRWGEILGYDINELNPTFSSWENLVHPDDLEVTMLKFNEHLEKIIPFYEAEFRMKHKDGTWRWILARGKIVEWDDECRAIRATGIHIDVTDKKLMEFELKQSNEEYQSLIEELSESFERIQLINSELEKAKERAEESDRLKTAFLGNMSHEVRTPMNGILGFIDLLKTPNLENDRRDEYIKVIESSGKRLMNIINDLIDISKIEEGLVELNLRLVPINTILEELYDFFKPMAESRGLSLVKASGSNLADTQLLVDEDRISQVLSNLLDNAIKFTLEGEIVFGFSKKGSDFEFFVKDSGIGIQSELQDVIFERFRQADTSISRGYEGSGLGLSISKAFIEMHGGKLWVESEYGHGSTFFFTIPNKNEGKLVKDSATSNHETKKLNLDGVKVLIAEDDQTSFIFLKETLDQKGLNIIHATNGQEAVDLVNANPDIALILMDIKMPYMDGMEATKQIKAKFSEIPIIAQTAFAQVNDKQKLMLSGCDDYITKPIKKELLYFLLDKHIRTSDKVS